MPYTPSEYWSDLHVRHDLSAVGQSGLPDAMNRQLYRILERNLRRFLSQSRVTSIGADAFEVGAGSGYWFHLWRELGAQWVNGCDLIPDAVTRLREHFGNAGRFEVADVGAGPLDLGAHDFVACMNVLLHVTDDTRFDQALANLARLVAPGGRLLLTEPILLHAEYARPYSPEASSRARPLERYRDGLEGAGLKLDRIAAATAIGNNPIESAWPGGFLAWRAIWAAATRPTLGRPTAARISGTLLYALDPLAMRLGAAPSSKFALFSRAGY